MTLRHTAANSADPLRALQEAQRIRRARAQLKRRIGNGEISAAEIILDPPAEAITWSLIDVLLSQPRWGHAKSHKFLRHNQLNELKQLGALTDRQRKLIAEQLSAYRR